MLQVKQKRNRQILVLIEFHINLNIYFCTYPDYIKYVILFYKLDHCRSAFWI